MIIEDIDYKYSCNMYKVKQDDTIELLLENFNIDCNDFKVEDIKAGKVIIINNYNTITYVVKPLDSFYSIAKNFSTSIDRIKSLNNIENLFIGQKIFIER